MHVYSFVIEYTQLTEKIIQIALMIKEHATARQHIRPKHATATEQLTTRKGAAKKQKGTVNVRRSVLPLDNTDVPIVGITCDASIQVISE